MGEGGGERRRGGKEEGGRGRRRSLRVAEARIIGKIGVGSKKYTGNQRPFDYCTMAL